MPPPSASPSGLPAEESESEAESSHNPRKRHRRIPLACNEKAPKAEYPTEYVTFLESRIASLEARLAEIQPGDELANDHLAPSRRDDDQGSGSGSGSGSGGAGTGEVKNEIAAGVALLSLNSASEPHYLGGSSGYSWAKVLLGTLHRPASSLFRPNETFKARYKESKGVISLVLPDLPNRDLGKVMVDSFYMHVQARYAFVDWIKLRGWLARQSELVKPKGGYDPATPEGREQGTASFFIWITYAIGARLLQGVALPGIAEPEAYYAAALDHLDHIVTLHNIENVQAFLYLAMYSLRCAEGPSVWHLTGIATRMCLELGMHRRRKLPRGVTQYQEEIRKRTFWTVYGLDRWFALTLGRPLGIDDRDIDQSLPLDVNCDLDSPIIMPPSAPQSVQSHSDSPMTVDRDPLPTRPFTSMSSAIHGIRLRRIEAQIQRTAYSLDGSPEECRAEITALLDKLDRWKEAIPRRPLGPEFQNVPCCTDDWFLMKAESLYLLRPITAKAARGDPLLSACAQSCVQQCEVFRRMHQNYPLANSLSLTDLHNIFLTGLTLLHLLLTHPRVISMRESTRAIRACSTALFVYAQHFKAAEPFRDAFEDMANACLDACERAAEDEPVQVERQADATEWERHVGEMAAWMMNSNAQQDFLQLVTSLGFNPNVPLDCTHPTPLQQELLFTPQLPFQAPLYAGPTDVFSSLNTSTHVAGPSTSEGTGQATLSFASLQAMQPTIQPSHGIHPSFLTTDSRQLSGTSSVSQHHQYSGQGLGQGGQSMPYPPSIQRRESSEVIQGDAVAMSDTYTGIGNWYNQYNT